MATRNNPRLGCKFVVGLGKVLYGNRYFNKKVKLIDDKTLSSLQPPYIVLANHSGFADVGGVSMLCYPTIPSFVTSETQLLGIKGKVLGLLGVIKKKQFVMEPSLFRDIKYVLSKNRPVVIYPEAKFSVDGTENPIKPAIAKLVKICKVPLVTVCFKGNYVHHPRWAKDDRFCPLVADVKVAVSNEELATISVDEIAKRITENLSYDDYKWQRENKVSIKSPKLVEGLEHILYKCPHCGKEFVMTAHGDTLSCSSCGYTQQMTEYGELTGGKFNSVHEWYAWQKSCVYDEVASPSYSYSGLFKMEALGKNHKFGEVGEVTLTHDGTGFTVLLPDGSQMTYPRGLFYTLSFNNDYIFLPTVERVYRLKPNSSVGITTKLNLAVEQQALIDEQGENK